MNTSWYATELVEEFTTIIAHSFPQVKQLLDLCYVKVVESFWGQETVHFLPYIAIYCPDSMIAALEAQKNVLREVAEFLNYELR